MLIKRDPLLLQNPGEPAPLSGVFKAGLLVPAYEPRSGSINANYQIPIMTIEPRRGSMNTNNLWPSCMNNRGAVSQILVDNLSHYV